jgi:RND family efflux transporter MFP subunit
MTESGEKFKKILLQLLMVVVVLGIGVGVFKLLGAMRKAPERKEQTIVTPLLNGLIVHEQNLQMLVSSYGTVSPKIEVQVVPQVSGGVVACHKNFVNGGFFKASEPLISIDPRDYELAVETADAVVARSQVALDTERAEGAVAESEWRQLNPGSEPASPLVLREPQIRDAQAQLRAAKAQLETARLNLERTVISMPFNGRVANESVDIGQYLMAGQPVATVYSTDVVEIVVPLEDRELAWFQIPGAYSDAENTSGGYAGPKAIIKADFAGSVHTWTGRVVRSEGQIDIASRMVNVVVEVANPFELSDGKPPLVPGMFVEVEIEGKTLDNIIKVPRYTVHGANEIWVARGGKLYIEQIQVVRRDKEYAYVAGGLKDGDVIITSPLDTVTDGMDIRTQVETSPDNGEAFLK